MGKNRVTEFIDHILRIDDLIDPAMGWKTRKIPKLVLRREEAFLKHGRMLMTIEIIGKSKSIRTSGENEENSKVKKLEAADELELFKNPIPRHTRIYSRLCSIEALASRYSSYVVRSNVFNGRKLKQMLNEGWASKI